MINIPISEFMEWFLTKINNKYAMKMQSLRRSFIYFSNLADQVIVLYHTIRKKIQKYSDKEQYKDITGLLNRSLLIIAKIAQKMPICLDSIFCQKFIKTFEFNINLLCTYYHSLTHFELIKKQVVEQKEKIVLGINKMYSIHVKIKEFYKHDMQTITTLTLISEYKRNFNHRIASIIAKLKKRKQTKDYFSENFENQATQFYQSLIEKINLANGEIQVKRSLMKMYFQLMHQQLSAQAQLELLMDNCIKVCSDIRNKKKNISFVGQQSCNHLTRWINTLLKPNNSFKNIKKLKVQQFIKCISTVLQQKQTYNYYFVQNFQINQQQIFSLANLIIDISKQIQKIEQSGLLNLINQYKDNLMPTGSKKFSHKLSQYQTEMSNYYALHQQMKLLQVQVQLVVLEQIGEKVNIIFEDNEIYNEKQ